jgi:hypothetical protein
LRGVHPGLEAIFDAAYARRPAPDGARVAKRPAASRRVRKPQR